MFLGRALARLTHALLTSTDRIHSNSCTNAHRSTCCPFKNGAKRR